MSCGSRVGGVQVGSVNVSSATFAPYVFDFFANTGSQQIRVEFVNDFYAPPQDRNLLVDSITVDCD